MHNDATPTPIPRIPPIRHRAATANSYNSHKISSAELRSKQKNSPCRAVPDLPNPVMVLASPIRS
jgi:hypothetical protein